MPYMPTYFYPKNCAIAATGSKGSEIIDINFSAILDTYDSIDEVMLYICGYGQDTPAHIFKIYLDKDNGETKVSKIEADSEVPISIDPSNISPLPLESASPGEANRFFISLRFSANELPAKRYTWKARFKNTSKFDVWIVDGDIQSSELSGTTEQIKIFPSPNLGDGQRIFDRTDKSYDFSLVTGYFDKSTVATKIDYYNSPNGTGTVISSIDNLSSAQSCIITLAQNIISDLTESKTKIDIFVTVDASDYTNIRLNAESGTITINGTIAAGTLPSVASLNVFGQYINVFRKYATIAVKNSTKKKFFNVGDYYSIYSNSITSNDNYFTIINYTLSIDDSSFVEDGTINTFTGNYSGNIDWYQWRLYLNGSLIDETEKIYSNKIVYQYNNFHAKADGSPQEYRIELEVHDRENYTYKTSITRESSYKRAGASSKLKCSWDANRKAIKVSLKDYVQLTGDVYLVNGSQMLPPASAEGKVYNFKDGGLYINPGYKVVYSKLGHEQIAYDKSSSMIVKLRLDKDFVGPVMRIGDKTFSILNTLVENGVGGHVYSFDDGVANIYSSYSDELLSNAGSENVNKDTQFYLSNNSVVGGDTLYFYYNDILATDDWYILINQEGNQGTVYIYSDNTDYRTKVFHFSVFEEPIDNITIYERVLCKKIQMLDSSSTGLDIFDENTEIGDIQTYISNITGTIDEAAIWPNGALIQTNYEAGQLNISNEIAVPNDGIAHNYIIYKQCSLLNDSFGGNVEEIIDIGELSPEYTEFYDYSVGAEHIYTYYIVQTYYDKDKILRALPEIISETIEPDYYEVDIFGTSKMLADNIYELDPEEKWYFELDANADDISYQTEATITSSGKYAKVNKTDSQYMQGSVTAKLGSIMNEFIYVNDNRHYLEKFKRFAQKAGVKGLRLKNGMVIPVDISIKSAKNTSNVVGNPTDIIFDWYQIGDAEKFVLIEPIKGGSNK